MKTKPGSALLPFVAELGAVAASASRAVGLPGGRLAASALTASAVGGAAEAAAGLLRSFGAKLAGGTGLVGCARDSTVSNPFAGLPCACAMAGAGVGAGRPFWLVVGWGFEASVTGFREAVSLIVPVIKPELSWPDAAERNFTGATAGMGAFARADEGVDGIVRAATRPADVDEASGVEIAPRTGGLIADNHDRVLSSGFGRMAAPGRTTASAGTRGFGGVIFGAAGLLPGLRCRTAPAASRSISSPMVGDPGGGSIA